MYRIRVARFLRADFVLPFPDEDLEVFRDGERGACHQQYGGMLPGFGDCVKGVTVNDLHHDVGSESNKTRIKFTEAYAECEMPRAASPSCRRVPGHAREGPESRCS